MKYRKLFYHVFTSTFKIKLLNLKFIATSWKNQGYSKEVRKMVLNILKVWKYLNTSLRYVKYHLWDCCYSRNILFLPWARLRTCLERQTWVVLLLGRSQSGRKHKSICVGEYLPQTQAENPTIKSGLGETHQCSLFPLTQYFLIFMFCIPGLQFTDINLVFKKLPLIKYGMSNPKVLSCSKTWLSLLYDKLLKARLCLFISVIPPAKYYGVQCIIGTQ